MQLSTFNIKHLLMKKHSTCICQNLKIEHLQLKIHDSLKSKEFTVVVQLKKINMQLSTFNIIKRLKFKI